MKQLCRSGLDLLFEGAWGNYRGARVGLIANPASVDGRFRHAVDRFATCTNFRLAVPGCAVAVSALPGLKRFNDSP